MGSQRVRHIHTHSVFGLLPNELPVFRQKLLIDDHKPDTEISAVSSVRSSRTQSSPGALRWCLTCPHRVLSFFVLGSTQTTHLPSAWCWRLPNSEAYQMHVTRLLSQVRRGLSLHVWTVRVVWVLSIAESNVCILESFHTFLDHTHTHTHNTFPQANSYFLRCYTEWVKCQPPREAQKYHSPKMLVLLISPVHCTDFLLFATVNPIHQVSLHVWPWWPSPSSPVNLLRFNYSCGQNTEFSWRYTWSISRCK